MTTAEQKKSLREFQKVSSIGPKLAAIFVNELDFQQIANLKNENPDKLFLKFLAIRGEQQCRCVLYSFRCVIAFARKPHKKNWWDFKD